MNLAGSTTAILVLKEYYCFYLVKIKNTEQEKKKANTQTNNLNTAVYSFISNLTNHYKLIHSLLLTII